jgi:hypothetical protein
MSPAHAVERQGVLSIDTIKALSQDIAAEYDSRLEVIGIASTDGESGRVEILVTIRGCHEEPCVVMVNLTRLGQAAFERDLRNKLRGALAAQTATR